MSSKVLYGDILYLGIFSNKSPSTSLVFGECWFRKSGLDFADFLEIVSKYALHLDRSLMIGLP